MTCIGCQPTKPVLNCINQLTIGTLESITDYNVYFENASNGKVTMIEAESDSDGLLVVDLSFTPLADTQYKVWATLTDASNTEAYETILIDGIEATCLYVTFQRVYGSDNASITATNQTLSI